jgi:hypothetical protein
MTYPGTLSSLPWYADLRTRQPALAALGLLYLAMAVPALAGTVLDPRLFNGVSVWVKPLKFLLSLTIYAWTLAWLAGWLDDAARRSPSVRWLARIVVATSLLEIAYIGIQAARGEASHFNRGTPVYELLYTLMGLAAVVLTACSAWLAWLLARHPDRNVDPLLLAAAVIGLAVSFILGAGTGSYLGGQDGHWVGGTPSDAGGLPLIGWSRDGGDLRIAHFLGIHAVQAIVLLAALLVWRRPRRAAMLLAVGTLLYIGLTAWTFALAVAGRPLFS